MLLVIGLVCLGIGMLVMSIGKNLILDFSRSVSNDLKNKLF